MKRKRMELLLIVLTTLALGAGVAAGLLAARLPATASTPTVVPADRSPLVEALQLSPEQCDKMRMIWEGVRSDIRRDYDRAQSLEKQRDDALVALLDDQQKAKFEQISRDFAGRFDELSRSRDQTFRDAVSQSKKLLSPEQQKKYDEILRAQVPGSFDSDAESAIGPPLR